MTIGLVFQWSAVFEKKRLHHFLIIASKTTCYVAEGRELHPFDYQRDMCARLFRERSPTAFGVLVDPEPPILAKVPTDDTPEEITRRCNGVLTVGAEQFQAADALLKAGKTTEAKAAFEKLCAEYPNSWIDRVASERLSENGP